MSGNNLYKDLCYNEIKPERIQFLFEVKGFFKTKGCVTSSMFPSIGPDEVGKWILRLYRFVTAISDTVIEIQQETTTVNFAKVTFFLMNEKGAVTKHYVTQYVQGDKFCCYVTIPGADIINASGVLADDELMVVCELEIQVPPVVRSHCLASAKCETPLCHLAEDLGQLLASRSPSDVTFAMVGGAQLKAHKNILAATSPVFAAMFSNQMLEKETGVVEITDVDADVFQAMLEFIYTGKDVVQTGWAPDLLAAASKYQLERLKVMCEEALGKNLTLDNVLENLALADLHSAARLKQHCINFFMEHRAEVLRSPAWETFKHSQVSLLAEVFEKFCLQ